LFGEVVGGNVRLNDAGVIVDAVWRAIPKHFPCVVVDEFVVMPNHVHGVLALVGAPFMAPRSKELEGAMNRAPTLGNIIRTFKARVSVAIHQQTPSIRVWQRNYYEHIIRNDESLNRIRQYILDNPTRWALDRENPANTLRGTRIGRGAIHGAPQ